MQVLQPSHLGEEIATDTGLKVLSNLTDVSASPETLCLNSNLERESSKRKKTKEFAANRHLVWPAPEA